MADRRQVRAVVDALTRVTERVVTKIALDVVANLVETTPVDTGWARGNWVPSIGTPFIADLGSVTPTVANANAASSRQATASVSVATGYRLRRGSVFVSNNVPYITELNDGSSAKAPAGFVQLAIAKAVQQDFKGLS